MNPFKKTARWIALKLALIFAGVASVAAPARAEWSTYQGNAAHTGYVPGNFDASHLSLKWSASYGPYSIGGLAVGGGAVYFDGPSVSVTALNEQTGAVLWSNPFTYGVNRGQVSSTSAPAYANGMVYYQTDNEQDVNLFHGVNATTGAQVFATSYDAQWDVYLNPTPYGGNIYTGGGRYGGMYSYNAAGGSQNWFGNAGPYYTWTPAVDGKYAYCYTGSPGTDPRDGLFRMIDLATGSTTYLVTDILFQGNGDYMDSAVVLGSHNDAFAVDKVGGIYPYVSGTGRLICFSTQADSTHTPHIAWVDSGYFKGQPTLANGVLYANDGPDIVALNELTGNILWSWTPPMGTPLSTMIATDNVLFVSTSIDTYALDLTTHQVDWSYDITGNMALSDGTLFIAVPTGTVYAFATPEPSAIGFVILGFGLLMRSGRRD